MRADNTQLASGDAAGVVHLWNPADGSLQGTLETLGAHAGPVSGLAYHPSDGLLLTSGEDGSVKTWSLPPAPAKTLAGHTDAVTAVTISTDGKTVITGGADATVRIFSSDTAQQVRALAGQPGPVASLAQIADGALVASGSDTGVIKLWNTADGADRLSLSGHTGPVHGLAIHGSAADAPASRIASAGADGTIRIWQLPQPAKPLAGHLQAVGSVAFSGNNAQLGSGDAAGEIRLWNVAGGAAQGTLLAHADQVTGMLYHPDGKQLLSTSADGTFKWWQLPVVPGKALATQPDVVNRMALSPDGANTTSGPPRATPVVASRSVWCIRNPKPPKAWR